MTLPLDPNVENIRAALLKRQQAGFLKYGVNTDRTDIDLLGWLQHLQEELLDASVYCQAAMEALQREKDRGG